MSTTGPRARPHDLAARANLAIPLPVRSAGRRANQRELRVRAEPHVDGGGAPLAAAKKVGNHGASYESLDYDKCINKYYMEKEKEITKHATALPGRTTRARHPGSPRAEGRSARTHAVRWTGDLGRRLARVC